MHVYVVQCTVEILLLTQPRDRLRDLDRFATVEGLNHATYHEAESIYNLLLCNGNNLKDL